MKNCSCCFKTDVTVIEHLQKEMSKHGFISKKSIFDIAKKTGKPVAEIYGVASFYAQFKFEKSAENIIEVCTGTACFVLGSETLIKVLEDRLKIKLNEQTPDGKFELREVRCLGACENAPVVKINGVLHNKMTPSELSLIIASLKGSEK